MRYVTAFFGFWRNFIIGGDWTIASTVVWGLAFVFVLVRSSYNAWYVLPLVVIGSTGWSAQASLDAKSPHKTGLSQSKIISKLARVPLWIPMIAVVVLPLLLFQLSQPLRNDLSVGSFLLPVTLNLLVVTVLAIGSGPFYKARPLAVSLITAVLSVWLLVDRVQPWLQTLAIRICDATPPARIGLSLLCLALTLLLIVKIFRKPVN